MNDVPLPCGLNIVLPITAKRKSYPFEIELDSRTKTKGLILCFQIRTIDPIAGKAKYIESVPSDILDACYDCVKRVVGELG